MTPRLSSFLRHLADNSREGLCVRTLTQSGPLWWSGMLPPGGAVAEGEKDWSFLPSDQCLHPPGERTGKGTHVGRGPGWRPHRRPPGALSPLTCTEEGVEAGDGWVSGRAPSASLASSSSSSPSSMVGVSPGGEAPVRLRGFRPGPWGVFRRRVSGGRWVDSG